MDDELKILDVVMHHAPLDEALHQCVDNLLVAAAGDASTPKSCAVILMMEDGTGYALTLKFLD